MDISRSINPAVGNVSNNACKIHLTNVNRTIFHDVAFVYPEKLAPLIEAPERTSQQVFLLVFRNQFGQQK